MASDLPAHPRPASPCRPRPAARRRDYGRDHRRRSCAPTRAIPALAADSRATGNSSSPRWPSGVRRALPAVLWAMLFFLVNGQLRPLLRYGVGGQLSSSGRRLDSPRAVCISWCVVEPPTDDSCEAGHDHVRQQGDIGCEDQEPAQDRPLWEGCRISDGVEDYGDNQRQWEQCRHGGYDLLPARGRGSRWRGEPKVEPSMGLDSLGPSEERRDLGHQRAPPLGLQPR
jgi:hypothetical protein